MAGTTLNAILRRSFGARHCDIRLPLVKRRKQRAFVEAADLRRVRRLYRNLRGIAGHNVKPYAELKSVCPDIQFFTFLRDPSSRFRSHFLNWAPDHSQEAFDRWTAAEWVRNWQTKMIAGEPNSQKAIDLIGERFGFVGFTERFDESLLLMRDWMREPELQLQYPSLDCINEKRRSRDAVRRISDMSYLDSDATRARIQEVNAEDQKVYDFVASKVYPRQVATFDGDISVELFELKVKNLFASGIEEPFSGSFMRNYIYKPLLHCCLI
jgi:hypothetical protein